ncbi:MAG: beta-ketoacyl-[acyl-carrier-protein] synthase family protein, partial [Geodermatophilaceae bacterium]|nr:beta-ketoacyl-[acyl-carrier-protein] synthase family protein [Geodermatophilaceae bacterium]
MNSGKDRVVVTGLGLRCALGADPAAVFERLLAGDTGARRWPDLEAAGFPIAVAHRIDDGDTGAPERRGRRLAVDAAADALGSAGWNPGLRVGGVFVGSTMGESAGFEARAEGSVAPLRESAADTFATEIAHRMRLTGPRRTFGTACAAGNYAIGNAARAIDSGRVDRVLAGGVEPFSRLAMLGFARLRAMSGERCRPFDAERRGMQLGEGAALLVLERESAARRRDTPVLAVVGGLGLSADAHHPTSPRPDGSGIAAAMRRALSLTGLGPADVGWVNAHGTGTAQSDAAEAQAVASVFGPASPEGAAPGAGSPGVSSLKGALGHCLGAASAIEALLSVVALGRAKIPPNVGLRERDDTLPIDVVTAPRDAPDLRWVMNCGYAFGGVNSALM